MKLRRTKLMDAIASALVIGVAAFAAVPAPALAQTATSATQSTRTRNPKTLQTVVVTGSHIPRSELETDNPVITIGESEIKATGKLTLGSVIAELPSITGGMTSPTNNTPGASSSGGGGTGATKVGLRGLGASRTLVLINGQRVLNNDLNSIPTAAVERIEVMTSGASAVYGSDAIGGVINIILKDRYNGAQFTANYGISDRNDGRRDGGSFIFGQSSDKGSLMAGVSYNKFEPIMQGARAWSAVALSADGTIEGRPNFIVSGSSFPERGFITVGPELSKKFGCAAGGPLALNVGTFQSGSSPTNSSDYHCFGTSDTYDFAAVNYNVIPQERTNAFLNGTYHISDHVSFYGLYYHNKTSSAYQIAPALLSVQTTGVLTVNKDSYYNPFGVDFSPNGANVQLRLVPMGNRGGSFGTTTDELQTGFRGSLNVLGNTWRWDVGYDYGHVSQTLTVFGLPNADAILPGIANASMLDPATGQVVCVGTPGDLGSIISGCTPWDPFNLNAPQSIATLRAGAAPALTDEYDIERIYHADANGSLFDLPGGTVRIAAGVQYRREYTNNTVGTDIELDPSTGTCVLGSQCSAHLQGGFNVKEAYAEMLIPILKDMPFAHGLNMTIADRYSKYSDVGSTSNWKIGMEWRPITDLLLRGTVAKVFRAPTIADVFGAPISEQAELSADPCEFSGSGPNPNAGNPACVGVPTVGPFKNINVPNVQPLESLAAGSKAAGFPLSPEMGKSFDFGVVYSPRFLPGLSTSIDFWRIFLNDTITSVGVQTVMNECFAGVTTYCGLIDRAQGGLNAGQINRITQPTANLGRIDVRGMDFTAAYQLPHFAFGNVRASVQGTYFSQYKIQTAPGTDSNEVIDGAGQMGWAGSELGAACPFAGGSSCFFPRASAQGRLDWQLGPWSAGWRMRWTSPFRMAGAPPDAVENLDRYGSYVYNDLHAGYEIAPLNTSVQVGVDNVFDKQPPILGDNRSTNSQTDATAFDVVGRYYWARLTVSF